MSDEQPGPGWWLASDGRWYPPEQAPAPPPPTWPSPSAAPAEQQPAWSAPPPAVPPPPTPKRSTGAKVVIALVVLVGVLLLLGGVVAVLGGDSDDDEPASTPVESPDAPSSFQRFTDPDGQFSLELHPDWIPVPLRGDIEGAGTRAAPDDPERAAALDAMIGTVPRQVVFIAADGERLGSPRFVPNINLIPIPREGASLEEVEASAPESVAAFGATGARVTRTTTASGEALRMTYRFDTDGPLRGVEGIQYYLFTPDTVWVLTMTSDDMADDEADFDAAAAGFTAP